MYTIKEAKKAIKDGIQVYLLKDKDDNYIMNEVNRLPFYLEGSPGIGKTEIVRQIANELGIGYVSFSLTHHTRNTLLGLPVIKDLENGKYTEYTMSEIIAKVLEAYQAGAKEGVLLLDEFTCVSDSILPAMLAFLQTKNIGAHHLPEGWVIVLCGNPPEYNKNARRFDAAILDRVRRISIQFDPQVFVEYAQEKDFHVNVTEYLRLNPGSVYSCNMSKNAESLVTCRGWENLSHTIKGMEAVGVDIDHHMVKQFIKDERIAIEFLKFYRLNRVGLTEKDISDILAGRIKKYYEKYKDSEYSIWWNAIELMSSYIETNHAELDDMISIMNLANDIFKDLKESNCLYPQILDRYNGDPFYGSDVDIDRWRPNSNKFVEKSDIEQDILEMWMEALSEAVEHKPDFFPADIDDPTVLSVIAKCCKELEKETNREMKKLGNEIGNVIKLVKLKDKSLEERIYHIINHKPLFIKALYYGKNKDYAQMCKENYAVGA